MPIQSYANHLVIRYHNVVSCAVNMEYITSNSTVYSVRNKASYINTNEMQLFSFYLVFITPHVSEAVLRPSSGVLQTVLAATGVCHGCGVE